MSIESMKRCVIYLITLIAVLLSSRSVAQGYYGSIRSPQKRAEMGISVGATAPFMTTHSSDGVSLSPKAGMRAAMMMALVWHDEYALQVELAYLYNNINASRFNVGPVLSLAASGKYSNGTERIEFGRVRPTVGYTAGVGVAVSQHIVIDARFTGGLRRTNNYFEGAEFLSSAYWAMLSVSYLF